MDNKKIANMKIGGKILAEVMLEVLKSVKPGITELDIEKKATDLIIEKGAEPGFKMVPGYDYSTCISVNDVVVHGIPKNKTLKEGDIIGIDCGAYYGGYHTDMSETVRISNFKFPISNKNKTIDKFLETGKKALSEAIKQAKAGNRVGHISKTIQDIVEGAGYSVVRSLVGHGIGKSLHEDPEIPGRLGDKKIEDTPLLLPGMTIAIEVIYNMGKSDVIYDKQDRWTISTSDKSLSGLFEKTILVTEKEPLILTPLVY